MDDILNEELMRRRDVRPITCFFTGHRNLPAEHLGELTRLTEKAVHYMYSSGYRRFICGGAVGFDTLAAQTVLRAKHFDPEIKLILALPCRNQTRNWKNTQSIIEYRRIKALADEIVYIDEFYTPDCMKKRNRYMVDSSSACIAYYLGDTHRRSGTGQTFSMVKAAYSDPKKIVNVAAGLDSATTDK